MSADLLREAAAAMRERAEAATPGPWEDFASTVRGTFAIYHGIMGRDPEVDICVTESTPQASMDRDHIASWHPAVALAVADWLDHRADARNSTIGDTQAALGVARVYLGRDA